MIINGKNYLLLERRGCEFFKNDDINNYSDVGNYRLTTPGEIVRGKDNKFYCLEFTQYERYNYRKLSLRGGKPLKHPVKELVNINALHTATEYSNERGSWANLALEGELHSKNYSFAEKDILNAANDVSAVQFDAIKYVENITVRVPQNKNFTPANLMLRYAEQHHLQTSYYYDALILHCYSGAYRYLCFFERESNDGYNNITLTLERVSI